MLAVAVGISVSAIMLYNGLSQIQFTSCPTGEGNYEWVDGNNNSAIDWSDKEDFRYVQKGDYRILGVLEALGSINWSTSYLLWIL